MSLLTNIQDFIRTDASIAEAFTATPILNESIFIGFEPDTPDNCISIFLYRRFFD